MPQVEPSAQFTAERKIVKGAEPINKTTIFKGDPEEFEEKRILKAGSITRSVDFDTGKFSPGSLTLSIDNKDNHLTDAKPGSRTNGLRYVNKEVSIDIGLKLPNGNTEFLPAFDGNIRSKVDVSGNLTSSIAVQDIFKSILDTTVATKIIASDLFEYTVGLEDNRLIQSTIKYGKHRFLLGNEKKERDPFFVTQCFPADRIDSRPKGASSSVEFGVGELWWSTIRNQTDIADFYIWDYSTDGINTTVGGKIWLKITAGASVEFGFSDFGASRYITLTSSITAEGQSVDMSDYMNGLNVFANDDGSADPSIGVEIDPAGAFIVDGDNPAFIAEDLLFDSQFGAGIALAKLDFSSFVTPNLDRSFDKAFKFYQDEGFKLLTNITKETSLLRVIEEIALISNVTFFSTQRDSTSFDRRIKFVEDSPVINPATPELLNNKKNSSGTISKNTSKVINRVSGNSIEFTIDTRSNITFTEVFNQTSIEAYGEQRLDLSSGGLDSNVLVYESITALQTIAERILNRLSEPEEIYTTKTDLFALPFQLKDTVIVKDDLAFVNSNFQLRKQTFSLDNYQAALELSKFGLLFGPDPNNAHKHWAFADDAFADNSSTNNFQGHIGDKQPLNGNAASGTNVFTLDPGSTFASTIEVGMGLAVSVQGSVEQFLTISSISDSLTSLRTEENFSNALTSIDWSIGETFHVF